MPDDMDKDVSWPPPVNYHSGTQPGKAKRFYDLRRLATAIGILFFLNTFTGVAFDICDYLRVAENPNLCYFFAVLGLTAIRFLALVLGIIAFVILVYFAYSNLLILGRTPRYNPGSTVVFFFLPLFNLVLPCLVFCELLRLSTDEMESYSILLVIAWWIMWMIYLYAGVFWFFQRMVALPNTLYPTICLGLLSLMATVLTMLSVQKITRLQNTAFENMRADPSVSTTRRQ